MSSTLTMTFKGGVASYWIGDKEVGMREWHAAVGAPASYSNETTPIVLWHDAASMEWKDLPNSNDPVWLYYPATGNEDEGWGWVGMGYWDIWHNRWLECDGLTVVEPTLWAHISKPFPPIAYDHNPETGEPARFAPDYTEDER